MFDKNKITKCREEKKFTVDELMIALNNFGFRITSTTIRNWELGESIPNANRLGKIAAFFKKPISYFYNDK